MAEAVTARDGERRAPARPGRHRHRQVAGLPGAEPAARRAGRGRHRDARAAAPAGRARPAAAGRGGQGTSAGVDTSYAVLKGRSNYACLHRIREGVPDDQGALVELPEGSLGKKVLELRAWAEEEVEGKGSGERDHAPRHTDREWRQVSVNHRECLGAAKCPFGQECFAELAKEKAHRSHLIVTNHSLLAIDAIEGVPMIPDYDVVVIDEAHELTTRVTQAATDELWAAEVERAARRSQRHVEGDQADDLADAADALRDAIAEASPGRFERIPEQLADALVAGARRRPRLRLGVPRRRRRAERRRRRRSSPRRKGAVQEVFATAERMAADLRLRRALAVRGHRADAAPAVRRAAPGVGPDARQAADRQDRRLHLRDPDARRRLRHGRDQRRAQADRAGPGRADAGERSDDATAVARPRRRQPVRLRPAGDPVRRPAPAAAGPRRPGQGRSSTRSSSWSTPPRAAPWGCSPHAGARRGRRRGGPRAAAAPDHPRPGRRPAAGAGRAVRRATRTPACSARSASGRASTSRATPASWC